MLDCATYKIDKIGVYCADAGRNVKTKVTFTFPIPVTTTLVIYFDVWIENDTVDSSFSDSVIIAAGQTSIIYNAPCGNFPFNDITSILITNITPNIDSNVRYYPCSSYTRNVCPYWYKTSINEWYLAYVAIPVSNLTLVCTVTYSNHIPTTHTFTYNQGFGVPNETYTFAGSFPSITINSVTPSSDNTYVYSTACPLANAIINYGCALVELAGGGTYTYKGCGQINTTTVVLNGNEIWIDCVQLPYARGTNLGACTPNYLNYNNSGKSDVSPADACNVSITLWATCVPAHFGIGCKIYSSNTGTLLLGYAFIYMNGSNWNVDPVTGTITGLSSIQC
jgi:hypothetical protein